MEGSAMSTLTGLDRLNEIASSLRDEFGINLTDRDVRFSQGEGWSEVRAMVEKLNPEELGSLIAADPDTEQLVLHDENVLRSLYGAESGFGIVQQLAVKVIMRRIQRLCETTR